MYGRRVSVQNFWEGGQCLFVFLCSNKNPVCLMLSDVVCLSVCLSVCPCVFYVRTCLCLLHTYEHPTVDQFVSLVLKDLRFFHRDISNNYRLSWTEFFFWIVSGESF